MTEGESGLPPGVDTTQANIARVYDYWLGGTHNFPADRDAARAMLAVRPQLRDFARENRAFLARAVRFAAAAGIRQFIDIGSGIPAQGNVHEIAQAATPGARVVYADADPVAVAHSRVILAGNPDATVIQADLREPEAILADRRVRGLIDFGRPACLLLAAVLHFLTDDEDPWRIVATLCGALAPGSYLVISHGTSEGIPAELMAAYEKAYQGNVAARGKARSRSEIERFFAGLELAAPGLVFLPLWRPGSAADVPADPTRSAVLAGVARKP